MAGKRKPPIRQRPIQVKFFVDERELALIKQKMAQLGTENMSAYLRKMAIDGYSVNLDMPELHELTSEMKRILNSEKHIARQLNATGNIYEADIEEIKKNQEKICEGIKKTLFLLSNSDVSSAGVQPVLKEPPKGLGCFPTSISKSQLR
uniref:plasmid mobilization protein n=1 Tax=Candidatus Scatomorpha intestinigallinarum TaxID=2840923 RepID=UPI004027F245